MMLKGRSRSCMRARAVRRAVATAAPTVLFVLLTGQATAGGCAQQSAEQPAAGAAETPEQEFARFDVTESGWLSGTELDACNCRQYDRDGDGEVTKAEFMAGRAGTAPSASPQAAGRTPPPPPAPARTPPPPPPASPAPDAARELRVGDGVEAYIHFKWQPAKILRIGGGPQPHQPYDVQYGGAIGGNYAHMWISGENIRPLSGAPSTAGLPASGPRLGRYIIQAHGDPSQPPLRIGEVELMSGGRYVHYLGGRPSAEGTWTYASGIVRWQSGPFRANSYTGEFEVQREGRTHAIRLARGTIATNSN